MNYKNNCLALYKNTFSDDGIFSQRLFETCFEYCKYITVENEIASMLFAIPCEIVCEQNNIEAIYIFAAATVPHHRKKGLMASLIKELQRSENKLLLLRPANNELISYYEKFGFKPLTAVACENGLPFVKPLSQFAVLAQEYKIADGKPFTAMYYSRSNLNLEQLKFIYSME